MKSAIFIHFPLENYQIESLSLPRFFAMHKGVDVFVTFHKDNRHYDYHVDNMGNITHCDKSVIFSKKFDVAIAKSSSMNSYDRRYFENAKFKVNLTPMGIDGNKNGYDFVFGDGQLIKPPVPEMFDYMIKNHHIEKENIIIYPASIGTDKNQLELLNLVNPDLVKEFKIIFCGKSVSKTYTSQMVQISKKRSLNIEIYDFLDKQSLSNLYLKSRLIALCTDPRPSQPYDPSPRVIPEAITAGTPFLINDLVLIEDNVRKFGKVYHHGNSLDLNKKLSELLNESDRLSRDAALFSKDHYTMFNACQLAYNQIIEASSNE